MHSKPKLTLNALTNFFHTPLDSLLNILPEADNNGVLKLFRQVATTVPAYQDFIRKHGIHPQQIQTLADFLTLPPVTRENYIQHYQISELCRNGAIANCDLVAVSSGSTGKPTCWPRFISDEVAIAIRFEQIFHDCFFADSRSTLAVICFTLGTWVGGIYSANCCRYLAMKGYPITVVTPGNNLEEILRVVQELGSHFDQVVLLGYPPFLKDVIDRGLARGVSWSQYHPKLVTAGEVFSEEWRSLVLERVGSHSPCYDLASLYGTADAGVLGNETPLSITIRRFLANHPDIARELFGESRLPTLVQYQPTQRFFEVNAGRLLFSGDNGIPLIRYDILDTGGIITYEQMLAFLHNHNFDPIADLAANQGVNIPQCRGIRQLPFVYVFGRSNFAVSFFGANIYPENIAVGLEQEGIREWVTGKFVLQVVNDQDQNRFLSVVVELAPNQNLADVQQDPGKVNRVAESILSQLKRLNSEFANYVPQEYQHPVITLKSHGDQEYFPIGVKHRYTRNA